MMNVLIIFLTPPFPKTIYGVTVIIPFSPKVQGLILLPNFHFLPWMDEKEDVPKNFRQAKGLGFNSFVKFSFSSMNR
jgi:hypothetical protein